MWKQSFLLTMLSLTAMKADIWNEPPNKFSPGGVYVFQYDAQILTGMPTSSWHYTGYRLMAQVTFDFKDGETILMQLSRIHFLQMNSQINVDVPNVFLPVELFEEMSEEKLSKLLVSELQRPLFFQWSNGVVRHLKVDERDQFWSVNMKKGVLNMLNINLATHGREDRNNWSGAFRQSHYEDGIEGRCKSIYHWNRLPVATVSTMAEKDQSESNSVPITMVKTRDINDCLETATFEHALFLHNDCDEKRQNVSRNMIRAEATTRANITYWPKSKEFFMWDLKTESRYTFALINAKVRSISTFVKQNLTFIGNRRNLHGRQNYAKEEEEREDDEELVLRRKKESSSREKNFQFRNEDSLQMIVPIPEVMPLKNSTQTLKTIVFDLLNTIRAQMKYRDSNVTLAIREWVSVLRQAPFELLLKVHKECLQNLKTEPEIFTVFQDILPAVATKEALALLIETSVFSFPTGEGLLNIELTDASIARRVRSFAAMNHIWNPEVIPILMKAVEKIALQLKFQRRETFKAMIMTIGSLTNTFISRSPLHLQPSFEPENTENVETQVLHFFQKLLKAQIPHLNNQEKDIVVIKAIGNAGIRGSVPILREILSTVTIPTSVKVQCIWSMHKLASLVPQEIQKVLLALFFDVTTDAEIRIASYLIVMGTRPSRIILDSIVESTRREPVKQVQTFVFSHMKNVAESPCHCNCFMAQNISHILETVKIPDSGMQYSHTHHIPLTETETAAIRSGIIYTQDEFLPRSGNLHLLTQGNGRETNILEIGFRQQGLQKMLSKLIGPGSGKFVPAQQREELVKKLNSNEKMSDVNLSFYMKLFGEELGFWTMDEQLTSLIQEEMFSLPKELMQFVSGSDALPINMRRTYLTDGTLRIPTTFGLPFTANFTLLLHAQMRGVAQMKRGLFDKEMVHAQVQLTPLLFSQLSLEAGVDATISKSFVQLTMEMNVPNVKHTLFNIMYMKTGDVGFRFHVQKPDTEWNLLQVKSSWVAVYKELRDNNQWYRNQTQIPLKLTSETEGFPGEQKPPQIVKVDLRSLGLQVTAQVTPKYATYFQPPVVMQRPFFLNVTLQNVDNKQDGIELRVMRVTNKTENDNGTLEIQLLRSTLRRRDASNYEATAEKEDLNLVKQDKTNEESEESVILLSKLTLQAKQTEKSFMQLVASLKMKKTTLVFTVILVPPKHAIRFDPKHPLSLNLNNKSMENVFLLNCNLQLNENEILSYLMTFDMDEMAQKLFLRMSKNIQNYQAMHPIIRQCSKDLEKKFTNTPACFYAWRYMNLYNRWNHTFVIRKSAPIVVKRIMSFLLTRNVISVGYLLDNIRIIDVEEEFIFPMNKEIIQRQEGDQLYFSTISTSPLNFRIGNVHYLLDSTLIRVPHVSLPMLYPGHMYPTDRNLYTSIVRYFTERRYPATCFVHTSTGRALHVQTIDGLTYTLENLETIQNKQVLLMQDVDNTFQVTMATMNNQKYIQILTQGQMKVIQIVRQSKTGAVQVFVDGKEIKQNIVKNRDGQVVLEVVTMESYVFGGDNVMQIYFPTLGLTIRTDVYSILHIQVSPFFHSNLRGACGDFDGERRQELKSVTCQKFFLRPEDIFNYPKYSTALRNDATPNVNWLSLTPCGKNLRLLPIFMNATRHQ